MTLTAVPLLKSADLQMLRNYLSEQARSCVHSAAGSLPYRYVTPTAAVEPGGDDNAEVSERSTIGHYLQMYDWDACFFSQVAHNIGCTGLPLDVVRNFLSLKEADGYVPRTVSPQRVWDKGDQCKPFLCQSLLASGHTILDQNDLNGLEEYLEYFFNKRRDERGLYHWRNVLESGVDNNLALLAPGEAAKDENLDHTVFPDGRLLATDLSAYLYGEFYSFAEISRCSGREDLHLKFADRAAQVKAAIEEHLWNPALSLYCNLHPEGRSFVSLRCWTGLAPLLTGACSDERAAQVIERNVLHPDHFLRPAGIPSVAASERLYNQARRGLYGRVLVSNWQGPVWVLTNGMVVRALLRLGYRDGAKSVASRMISTLVNDLRSSGTLHENYHAETGEGLFAPNFMSWNILAIELLNLLEE